MQSLLFFCQDSESATSSLTWLLRDYRWLHLSVNMKLVFSFVLVRNDQIAGCSAIVLNVLLSLLFWQGLVTTAVLRPAA